MSPPNLNVLTQAHTAIAAKKRAKRHQVQEVIFDDIARHDFLTGFHKRKLAKTEAAKKKALEREKQQRQEDRREQRRMLRERAAENAAEIEKAYGATLAPSAGDQEWQGISDPGDQKEQEYEDEEVLATVAIVEDFDPDTLLHGPTKTVSDPESSSVPVVAGPSHRNSSDPAAKLTRKNQPKKVRYQTKDARKSERTKQRARRTEKAELAGGKASRKNRNAGGKGGKRR
ncbi:nucleolar protein 12-domain-containing protein [Lentinula lateritia]|uniref:Nucleolar protein 12-domain-containing protein n=1 Tax=Lentinula aff. lateritia TaxID=2804960 RepID=A0ACC1TPE8_9AGAR|nr:nucleolar protein 12-domain-containing protein [Lentinula aff. lateritia]KAJ3851262.1 nucleolar protein 12-domain-containing protein [Lentinula lateritia]